MVKVVIGRRADTNPNCYQTTSDTWALSMRHEYMTIHDSTIYTRMNTWLYNIHDCTHERYNIHGSQQCSLSMMHEHMTLRDCSHVWCKIHGSEHYETRKGWEKIQLKFILFNLYRLVLSLLKYKKAKAHPWQLCRSLHWVWGSRSGDLWAIGSTKMTS